MAQLRRSASSAHNQPVDKPHRFRVLFVCVGNACRSPMAEAIARHEAADIITPASAGIYPLGEVVSETRAVLLYNGYPTEGLESKGLRHCVTEEMDLIVNMSGMTFDRFPASVRVEAWPIEDPYGQGPEVYQRILEEIRGRVVELAGRLREKFRQV